MTTPQRFLLTVDSWVEKAKAAPMAVIRETVQDLNNEIIANTPVVTGNLRGSYFAAVNSIPSGAGTAGRVSSVAINALAANLNPGDVYFMGNTAAYARRIEYGFVGADSLGRQYNQQGRFYMRRALERVDEIAAAAAARIASRA